MSFSRQNDPVDVPLSNSNTCWIIMCNSICLTGHILKTLSPLSQVKPNVM